MMDSKKYRNSIFSQFLRIVVGLLIYWHSTSNVQSQERWTLQQCVDYALEHNLELQHRIKEIQNKELDWQIARNERLPAVQAYGNLYSNFGYSQDVFGTIMRNDNINSNMGITAEIALYNFRSLKNQALKALVDIDLQKLEKEILERELATNVIQAYLEILMQQALVQARDSAVIFSNKLYERAQKTTQIGTTAKSEVYEAKANLARERQQLETVKIDMERARLRLAQLLQLSDYTSIDVIDQYPTPSKWEFSDLGLLVSQSYLVQPGIKRYGLLTESLALEKHLIRAQLYPTVMASTSVGSMYFNAFRMPNSDPFFLQTRNNFAQQIAITALFPIFNKGRTRIQLKQLQNTEEQTKIQNAMEKQEIRQQVEKIYLDYKSNYQNLLHAEQARESTALALEFAEKSYEAGRISIYELNTSRQNFIQSESELLQARYSTIFSYKMLRYQVSETPRSIEE